jgi:hypothetical protein
LFARERKRLLARKRMKRLLARTYGVPREDGSDDLAHVVVEEARVARARVEQLALPLRLRRRRRSCFGLLPPLLLVFHLEGHDELPHPVAVLPLALLEVDGGEQHPEELREELG